MRFLSIVGGGALFRTAAKKSNGVGKMCPMFGGGVVEAIAKPSVCAGQRRGGDAVEKNGGKDDGHRDGKELLMVRDPRVLLDAQREDQCRKAARPKPPQNGEGYGMKAAANESKRHR